MVAFSPSQELAMAIPSVSCSQRGLGAQTLPSSSPRGEPQGWAWMGFPGRLVGPACQLQGGLHPARPVRKGHEGGPDHSQAPGLSAVTASRVGT